MKTSFAQSTYIKGKGYRGIIFDTSVFVLKSIKDQKDRHLLTKSDVEKAEQLLKNNLQALNQKKINQTAGCPIIHKKLKKFYRQYLGFINQKGEVIVWINCFWDKELIERARSEIIQVNDGCSYFWNIEVNITTCQLQDLEINGRG